MHKLMGKGRYRESNNVLKLNFKSVKFMLSLL